MDAFPSSAASSPSPQRQECHHHQHTASKKICLTTVSNPIENQSTAAVATRPAVLRTSPQQVVIASPPLSLLNALPRRMLGKIGKFAGRGSHLSGASKTTLKAIPEVHLKIDTHEKYKSFFEQGFYEEETFCDEEESQSFLIGPTGGLRSGRVVAHITTITARFPLRQRSEETPPPWRSEEGYEAFEKFMRHAIPTLRSITVRTERGKSPVLDALIPRSSKRFVVAPKLTRVVLRGQPTLVHKAGKAMAAGLWPALQDLDVSSCRANASQFENLARALRAGRAPRLRVLIWDSQSWTRAQGLHDAVLAALASGQCPLVELLSFADNRFFPEHCIGMLGDALMACSNLRVLEMDCAQSPEIVIYTLRRALETRYRYVPRLTWIKVQTVVGEGTTGFRALGRRIHRVRVMIDMEAVGSKTS